MPHVPKQWAAGFGQVGQVLRHKCSITPRRAPAGLCTHAHRSQQQQTKQQQEGGGRMDCLDACWLKYLAAECASRNIDITSKSAAFVFNLLLDLVLQHESHGHCHGDLFHHRWHVCR
jgi:hypothetical protein